MALFKNADDINLNVFHTTLNSVHGDQFNHFNIVNYYPDQNWIFDQLKPALHASCSVPSCLPGTREQVLHKIFHWLHDLQAHNIFWLRGGPGEGKSTIASTLWESIKEFTQLRSSFFCNRGIGDLSDPVMIWRTIAYDLAQSSDVFAERVIQNLRMGVDPTGRDIMSHFEHLIKEPLMELWDKSGENVTIGRSSRRSQAEEDELARREYARQEREQQMAREQGNDMKRGNDGRPWDDVNIIEGTKIQTCLLSLSTIGNPSCRASLCSGRSR